MAERNPQEWGTYLDELIVLFDSLPEGHKIHGKTKADVVAMRAGLTNGINAVSSGESTLSFSRGALKTIVSGVDEFATHVIPALTGDFGPDSVRPWGHLFIYQLTRAFLYRMLYGRGCEGGRQKSNPTPSGKRRGAVSGEEGEYRCSAFSGS